MGMSMSYPRKTDKRYKYNKFEALNKISIPFFTLLLKKSPNQ